MFRYPARRAVALKLAISLVTVVSSLLIRNGTLSLGPLLDLLPVALAMIAGAVSAAFVGVALVHRISEVLLQRFILLLPLGIGSALVTEAFLPQEVSGFLPESTLPLARLIVAALFGLFIGRVSSLLGLVGRELIIPTLVFVIGATIKVAGTASLLISLPTVEVGMLRHLRLGSSSERADPHGRADGRRFGGRGSAGRSGPSGGLEVRAGGDPHRPGYPRLPGSLARTSEKLIHGKYREFRF